MDTFKTFTITTLGCKVNRYESEALSESLENLGWQVAEEGALADLVILNTCTVTGKAAMQSRQAVRKTIRDHPKARVVVTGCYAQIAADVLASIPGVDCVVGHADKTRIPELACSTGLGGCGDIIVKDMKAPITFQDLPLTKFGTRTRAFVKIQDGCDAFCSYCIVPFTRGRSRSQKPAIAIGKVEELRSRGYSEVVVCGIHVGRYGQPERHGTYSTQLHQTHGTDREINPTHSHIRPHLPPPSYPPSKW